MDRALVLAAGTSSRIRSSIPDRPKPLIHIGGRSILEHNLDRIASGGISDVWINLHYRGEQVQALIGDGSRYGVRVHYSWEVDLLGTAGAALRLRKHFATGPFAVIYGDNLIGLDLTDMATHHRTHGAMATIAVFDPLQVANTGLAGGRIDVSDGAVVVGFEEGPSARGQYVNAGAYILDPVVLSFVPTSPPSDFGRDVFPALLKMGIRTIAYVRTRYCLAVDTPAALKRAQTLYAQISAARPVSDQ